MKLIKFGGSALATPDGIRRAAARVVSEADESIIVVVDAMGDNLTQLDTLASLVLRRTPSPLECCPNGREMDLLRQTGEQISATLLALSISSMGYHATAFAGWQIPIRTNSSYGKATITNVDCQKLRDELECGKVVVIAGSQGMDHQGNVTTLGRDGADVTAVAVAASLGIRHVELLTDTDGLFTADPRVVPSARQVPTVSYDELLELTSLGASVVHPSAVEYAKRHQITLHIRSGFTTLPGTLVKEDDDVQLPADVRGVAHDTNVTKLALVGVPDQPGIAYSVFDGLSKANISVDMIVQSQKDETTNDILFTVERQDADTALTIIETVAKELGAKGVARDDRVAKVSIVGAGMTNNSGVAARMFGALAKKSINIEVISTSEIRISCLIPAMKVEDAVRAIHQEFGLQG